MKPTNAYELLIAPYIIVYYTYRVPAACFGHSCNHPDGGALHRTYCKVFWTTAQLYDTEF